MTAKKTITTETAKAAANAKRLETMRANLEALETRADAILEKGDAMTDGDRRELLTLVNVAYHGSGKIDGCFSIDSCAACEFCQKMIHAAGSNVLMICGACYANADSWKEAAWRRHKLNARIFSSVLFTVDELKALSIPGLRCRFNEDGDTTGETMGRNYLRIAAAHPDVRFGYWFKNAPAVESALHAEGIHTREALPENVRFIHSSALIGFAARACWFDDAIFTVYPDAETTAAAIAAGAWECNGRKCMACGFQCYMMQRRESVLHVAEVLRTNAARRAVIRSAYDARMLQQRAGK